MISLELTRTLLIHSTVTRLVLITICLLAPILPGVVSAQTVPARPVARLITGTTDEVGHSRPRRVNVPASDTASTSATIPSIKQATETERKAFAATNEMRARSGFSPLSWDGELSRMARDHSENMARLGFFAHETPEGLRLKDRARAARIRFQVIGENIAYNEGVDDPGTFAVQRWMISSGHRANILSREFRASGVGSFITADGRVYITQIFIAR
ncbi:MAG: CAP domain-containing protein [Pyrinomonadaceae bacterium]|nr:CAP domain-containing protein [Pyrinomonadaceae bacterium]